MSRGFLPLSCLGAALFLAGGCATYKRAGLPPHWAAQIEKVSVPPERQIAPELARAILALDPEHVTGQQVRDVLARAPAPRIINIHGGVFPVHRRMISFSEFLVGMGYPRHSLRNPGDGTYTFSCYEGCDTIAGVIAWYYERTGLRPMMVGHSQGGMQAVKVLHRLADHPEEPIAVWNPLTWQSEERCVIHDPLTGETRPVVGLQLALATVVGSGGLARVLPNQWDINGRLREIPDSTVEFLGFQKGMDLLGGDFLGYGSANLYVPEGTAVVRNFRLPTSYHHGAVPDTEHLLNSKAITEWIDNYRPAGDPVAEPKFDADSTNILWAAEVWYAVKKHWVLELQRMIRAKGLAENVH